MSGHSYNPDGNRSQAKVVPARIRPVVIKKRKKSDYTSIQRSYNISSSSKIKKNAQVHVRHKRGGITWITRVDPFLFSPVISSIVFHPSYSSTSFSSFLTKNLILYFCWTKFDRRETLRLEGPINFWYAWTQKKEK